MLEKYMSLGGEISGCELNVVLSATCSYEIKRPP